MRSSSSPPLLLPFLASLLLILAPSLPGAQPISVYKGMQERAPEFLQIKLTKVKAEKSETERQHITKYTATAKVTGVTRTASKLKKGDTITIVYTRKSWRPGHTEPGPAPNPAIKKGDKGPAYLAKSKDSETYHLAAEAYSFATVK